MEDEIELSDYERGFLEGVIDGEGCIGLYKKKRDNPKGFSWIVTVKISNTNKAFLEKAKMICGNKGAISLCSPAFNATRDFYDYRIPVDTCKVILPQLRLIIKEEQRLLMIDALYYLRQQRWWTKRSDYDVYLEQISVDIKRLNK